MTEQQEAAPLTVTLERIADCMEGLLRAIDNLVGIYKASLPAAEDAPEKGGRIEDAQEREGMIESLAREYIDAGKKVSLKAIGAAVKSGDDIVALKLCRIDLRKYLPDQWQQNPTTPEGRNHRLRWRAAADMHKEGKPTAEIASILDCSFPTAGSFFRRWNGLIEIFGDEA